MNPTLQMDLDNLRNRNAVVDMQPGAKIRIQLCAYPSDPGTVHMGWLERSLDGNLCVITTERDNEAPHTWNYNLLVDAFTSRKRPT